MSRTKNSIINSFTGIIGQVLTVIIQFISRTVFIYVLSEQYLGIVGLFTNILSILSLSELGFGGAILYLIYKPIADDDKEKVLQYINLYRVFYKFVAIVVFIMGISIIPFLKYIIKDSSGIDNVNLIYMLYLINSVTSYLLIYKQSIIEASQKIYITIYYQKIFLIIQSIIQIIILIISRNFILYLLIQILCTLVCNILISNKADKLFPYLKYKKRSFPSKDEIKEVTKNTLAMSGHKIGTVIVFGTDNLLMSSIVSIASVGVYSNYTLIITTVNMFINIIFNGLSASIGNLVNSKEKDEIYKVYKTINFIGFWAVSFCSIGLFSLINPLIKLWIGEKYLFNINMVFVIIINFYINGMRIVTIKFRDVMGIFWYDRYKPIFEAVINLVVSIILTVKFGIIGIVLGTTISTLLTSFWVEPYVLYKYGFKRSVNEYFKLYFKYSLIFIISGSISTIISSLFKVNVLGFFLKFVTITLIYNLIIILMFKNTNEYKFILKKIKVVINNKISLKKYIEIQG